MDNWTIQDQLEAERKASEHNFRILNEELKADRAKLKIAVAALENIIDGCDISWCSCSCGLSKEALAKIKVEG